MRQEIEEVIGDDLDNVTMDQLKQLTYLECVQKEVMRMYPPLNGIFIREAVKDHYLDKIPIKKGMQVCG